MSAPYDRPAQEPGGCECFDCGVIFIGEEWHTQCAVCAAQGGEARQGGDSEASSVHEHPVGSEADDAPKADASHPCRYPFGICICDDQFEDAPLPIQPSADALGLAGEDAKWQPDDDRAQMLQDFMEQHYARCLRASEWDAIVAFLDEHPSPAAQRLAAIPPTPIGISELADELEREWPPIRKLITGLISDVECAIHMNEGVAALSGEAPEEAREGIARLDRIISSLRSQGGG